MTTQCTAIVKRTGDRCRKAPIKGATVCRSHGGGAPQVRIAAQRRVAVAEATALVKRMELEPMQDVPNQILILAAEARTLTDVLHARVADLHTLSNVDRLGQESISAVLGAYQSQLQHLGQLLISIAKLGLQDRAVHVQEAQLDRIVSALRSALADPNLSDLTYDQMQAILARVGELVSQPSTI